MNECIRSFNIEAQKYNNDVRESVRKKSEQKSNDELKQLASRGDMGAKNQLRKMQNDISSRIRSLESDRDMAHRELESASQMLNYARRNELNTRGEFFGNTAANMFVGMQERQRKEICNRIQRIDDELTELRKQKKIFA